LHKKNTDVEKKGGGTGVQAPSGVVHRPGTKDEKHRGSRSGLTKLRAFFKNNHDGIARHREECQSGPEVKSGYAGES